MMKVTSEGRYICYGDKQIRACKEQVKLFNRVFPNGAEWPSDQDKAGRAGLDTRWLFIEFRLTGTSRSYYGNGQLRHERNYKNGEEHGKQKWYYSNGRLGHERNYNDGERNGKQIEYYRNGQLRYELNYKNGLKHGKQIEYYKNGHFRCELNYKNGKGVQ